MWNILMIMSKPSKITTSSTAWNWFSPNFDDSKLAWVFSLLWDNMIDLSCIQVFEKYIDFLNEFCTETVALEIYPNCRDYVNPLFSISFLNYEETTSEQLVITKDISVTFPLVWFVATFMNDRMFNIYECHCFQEVLLQTSGNGIVM